MSPEFKVGHFTDLDRGTGCTVILCPENTRASAFARGISPGTREFALLSPYRKIQEIHALLLTGGSAFGLDAAAGVMRFLSERGRGYPTAFGPVPIVPAAVIFDLAVIDSRAFPSAEDAYQACWEAGRKFTELGNVGAGTGATVGKWAGPEFMMKGGTGISTMIEGELVVRALSIVNPVGDVVDEAGLTIAGAQREGRFMAERASSRRWDKATFDLGNNTILTAVMTNARLDKLQLYYLADRSGNGMVRAVSPVHTSYDGDVVFTLSTQEIEINIDNLVEISIEAVRKSIVNAVMMARPLAGIPSIKQ